MIKYSKEFYKKSFTENTMKEAYLKAMKWYSTNVISKAEFANVHVQIVKEKESEFPTITLHLFAVQDGEQDVMASHCEKCREMHNSFFINKETDCNKCNALGFQRRLEQKINVKKEYYKEMLMKKLGGK